VIGHHLVGRVQAQAVPGRQPPGDGGLARPAPAADPVDVAESGPQRRLLIAAGATGATGATGAVGAARALMPAEQGVSADDAADADPDRSPARVSPSHTSMLWN
jgi:hypothetical protein